MVFRSSTAQEKSPRSGWGFVSWRLLALGGTRGRLYGGGCQQPSETRRLRPDSGALRFFGWTDAAQPVRAFVDDFLTLLELGFGAANQLLSTSEVLR